MPNGSERSKLHSDLLAEMNTPARFGLEMLMAIEKICNALDTAKARGGGRYHDLERVMAEVDRCPLLDLIQCPTDCRESDSLVQSIIAENSDEPDNGAAEGMEGGAE